MNETDILLADNKDFKYVSIVFAPYTGSNTYTYKTTLELEVEDKAIVQTPSGEFKVVQVIEVLQPFEADLNPSINYKWIVQKLDTSLYEKSKQAEKELRKVVQQAKKKKAIEEARAVLSDIDTTKLVRL